MDRVRTEEQRGRGSGRSRGKGKVQEGAGWGGGGGKQEYSPRPGHRQLKFLLSFKGKLALVGFTVKDFFPRMNGGPGPVIWLGGDLQSKKVK